MVIPDIHEVLSEYTTDNSSASCSTFWNWDNNLDWGTCDTYPNSSSSGMTFKKISSTNAYAINAYLNEGWEVSSSYANKEIRRMLATVEDAYNLYTNYADETATWPTQYYWTVKKKGYHSENPIVGVESKIKQIIRSRQGPTIICDRKPAPTPRDIREIRARETLKRVLGDRKFRNFLSKGFVTVKAKSGLVYQIYPGHGISRVYKDGEQIERLCVVLQGDFAPTDSLLMRYLMILSDEDKFRSYAIKHSVYKSQGYKVNQIDDRSLVDIFRDLKGRKVA